MTAFTILAFAVVAGSALGTGPARAESHVGFGVYGPYPFFDSLVPVLNLDLNNEVQTSFGLQYRSLFDTFDGLLVFNRTAGTVWTNGRTNVRLGGTLGIAHRDFDVGDDTSVTLAFVTGADVDVTNTISIMGEMFPIALGFGDETSFLFLGGAVGVNLWPF